MASSVLDEGPHGRLSARLSHEHAIGTRSGCFCVYPSVDVHGDFVPPSAPARVPSAG